MSILFHRKKAPLSGDIDLVFTFKLNEYISKEDHSDLKVFASLKGLLFKESAPSESEFFPLIRYFQKKFIYRK